MENGRKTNNERRLPDEGRLEKESPIEREKVMRLEWVPCDSPKDLAPNQIAQIMQLFLNETGERYAEASVRHLPIPTWGGNLMLIDTQAPAPQPILGVLWATPFKEIIVRVAAFVIAAPHQGQALGSQAWSMFTRAAWAHGYRHVQLEVKAENERAQSFYQRRGMEIKQPLTGYYQSGLGYMMRGPLEAPEFTKDYSPPQSG